MGLLIQKNTQFIYFVVFVLIMKMLCDGYIKQKKKKLFLSYLIIILNLKLVLAVIVFIKVCLIEICDSAMQLIYLVVIDISIIKIIFYDMVIMMLFQSIWYSATDNFNFQQLMQTRIQDLFSQIVCKYVDMFTFEFFKIYQSHVFSVSKVVKKERRKKSSMKIVQQTIISQKRLCKFSIIGIYQLLI
eukprot:TRINITY_DN19356_c0_g1_i4.p1 TRINITY_DN19356_c0_g1~~TRINITY_DN19356_c0_g1_i4.p1  ORF type:complete len:187 (+),score=-13.67 TRINITY_DN19356_c0_g1_i4:142-702(+)